VDSVVPRADVIEGPFAPRAPHLFPVCRDQRIELSDTVAATSVLTDHRDRPWGYHHQDGIFIGAGPAFIAGSLPHPLDIVDILPTAFAIAGLSVPAGLDGHAAHEILSVDEAATSDQRDDLVESGPDGTASYPFSEEDEKQIEESLRGLGYIE
jgi:hypothetical protein